MNVLLYFASVIIIVYAHPTQKEEVNEETLKLVANSVLDISEGLRNDVEEISELIKRAKASASKNHDEISDLITKNESINLLQKIFKKSFSHGKNIENCQKIFEKKVELLNNYVHQRLLDVTEERLEEMKLSLDPIQTELNNIYDVLAHKLDSEIQLCRSDISHCRITGEFLIAMQKHFTFIDNLKSQINTLVENVLKRLEKEEVYVKYQSEIFKPVDECLKK